MKLPINAIRIAAIALMLTSVDIGSTMAESDSAKCPPPPAAGHPNIFMRTVQCSNLSTGTGSTGSAQPPIIGNKPPASGDGTKPLSK